MGSLIAEQLAERDAEIARLRQEVAFLRRALMLAEYMWRFTLDQKTHPPFILGSVA